MINKRYKNRSILTLFVGCLIVGSAVSTLTNALYAKVSTWSQPPNFSTRGCDNSMDFVCKNSLVLSAASNVLKIYPLSPWKNKVI